MPDNIQCQCQWRSCNKTGEWVRRRVNVNGVIEEDAMLVGVGGKGNILRRVRIILRGGE